MNSLSRTLPLPILGHRTTRTATKPTLSVKVDDNDDGDGDDDDDDTDDDLSSSLSSFVRSFVRVGSLIRSVGVVSVTCL